MAKVDPSRRAWPIFAIAVLLGLAGLLPFAGQAYRDVRITFSYRPTTCTVISSRTYDTSVRRSHSTDVHTYAHPELVYQVQVEGKSYTAVGFDNTGGRMVSASEALGFETGGSYPCWYDPRDPSQAVLRKQVYPRYYLPLAIPVLFLLVGGSMLTRSLRSVPAPTLEGRGQGETLAVRLQPELTGGRAVGCIGTLTVLWTAGVVALVAYLVRSDQLFDDAPAFLALAAVAVDGFLVYQLVRSVRSLGVPEPVVEIEREPLQPGGSARLYVRQAGPARFSAFKVVVLCEGQSGGGTRQHHRRQLASRKDLEVAAADQASLSATLEVPKDAQPSLRELQTIVTWKIVVERKGRFGDADREYVFRVLAEGEAEPTA